MIKSVLIANRGEIALRILGTLKILGIHGGTVYTPEDYGSLHRKLSPKAFEIPSYLDIDAIIKVAKDHGFQAIHPGYGFLSENPKFAQAVKSKGLIFIGPRPETMELMGSKESAKAFAKKHGVPVIEGYTSPTQTLEDIEAHGSKIGFPVLLKATHGGGGRGMRIVHEGDQLPLALQEAKAEAQKAFGNNEIMVEKYISTPRHVEVQVFGDIHGNAIHLYDRDCTLQRRHQKVFEEAPAPYLSEKLRARLHKDAVTLCKQSGYIGAGTVEFLVTPQEEYYFLEMNTRLQVEHPVTEIITELDLVELQLRIASGEEIPLRQSDILPQGHCVEVRLCAEDPETGFLPSGGRVKSLIWPEGVRIDTAIQQGSMVGGSYDSLIAKIISWGEDRKSALKTLEKALRVLEIEGVKTNRDFLTRLCLSKDVGEMNISTSYIETHQGELTQFPEPPSTVLIRAATQILGARTHWRPLDLIHETLELSLGGAPYTLLVKGTREKAQIYSLREAGPTLLGEGIIDPFEGNPYTFVDRGDLYSFKPKQSHGTVKKSGIDAHLKSPMPGKVSAVLVGLGDMVKEGDPLIILEAMKMEHSIKAPHDGVVRGIPYQVGQSVDEGVTLIDLEEGIPS